jgi:hypothetical protein
MSLNIIRTVFAHAFWLVLEGLVRMAIRQVSLDIHALRLTCVAMQVVVWDDSILHLRDVLPTWSYVYLCDSECIFCKTAMAGQVVEDPVQNGIWEQVLCNLERIPKLLMYISYAIIVLRKQEPT